MYVVERPEVVRTERLVLRHVSASDVPAITELRKLAAGREFLGGPLPTATAHDKALASIDSPDHYAVIRKDGQCFVGVVSLTPRGSETELSYEFVPDAWGHGFATEACMTFIRASTSADGDGPHLIAVTQRANRRSRSLLERLGMTVREEFVEYGAPQVLYETASS